MIPSATRSRIGLRLGQKFFTIEIILFLSLWLLYGATINSSNLEEFGVQQSGVEAIVERHQFNVDGLTSWPVKGDVFGYNGHTFSNKQPGQAMAGAVVYAVLRLFGLSYAKNRLLSAALVTFFTASLLTAVAGVVVYRLAWEFDNRESKSWAVVPALVFALGTTAFAYAGIAHHDTIATAFLVIGFYLIFTLSRDNSHMRNQAARAAFAGLLLALTLTTSMLHFFMVAVVGIYFLSLRRWKLLLPFAVGGIAGAIPLMFYNAVNFGNPLLMAAIANHKFTGYDPEVFFFLDWQNFVGKTNEYAKFLTLYAPVLWFGFLGLAFIQRKYNGEKYFLVATILVLVFYVVNVQGLGTCAYGPRYLLPMMPFASLGVIGLRRIPSKTWRIVTAVGLLLVGSFSVFVNFVGAVQGAMYCNLAKYALPDYLTTIMRGELRSFPLQRWLLPFSIALGLLAVVRFASASALKSEPRRVGAATG